MNDTVDILSELLGLCDDIAKAGHEPLPTIKRLRELLPSILEVQATQDLPPTAQFHACDTEPALPPSGVGHETSDAAIPRAGPGRVSSR